MQRWFRLSSLLLAVTAALSVVQAQDYVEVRGSLSPGMVRVFTRDTIYRISGTYTIGGTLVIEPGTRVEFLPNGRLIDSVGGRILADGRASATYNPNAANALQPPYTGYDDPAYFGAPGVLTSTIYTEPTIHSSKYGTIFNVDVGSDPNLQNLTPAEAVVYKAARLEFGGVISAIRLNPWFRVSGNPVNVRPARITFIAGDVNNFSREWGHIIILPGADAAFFRDVDFLNFRKDTTVDNEPIYWANSSGSLFTRTNAETANDNLLRATNGSGGAITTFSVRTWIVGCNFRNNMARYHAGALQILQAPVDQYVGSSLQLYPTVNTNNLPIYAAETNPFLTSPWDAQPYDQQLRAIDLLHTSGAEPSLTSTQRQSVDDGRLALYLGRIRQIRFIGNRALLSNVDTVQIGGIRVVTDVDRPATVFQTVTRSQKNDAFGGAVYISGRTPMIVGLGINDVQGKDTVEFTSNYAENRQPSTAVGNTRTNGARGGAVYVGDQTSVIFAGRYTSNMTRVPYIPNLGISNLLNSSATYSHGGAIYASAGALQTQIRGNLDNNPPTHFLSNSSGRGGAVYVSASASDFTHSPHIGGSDGIINARNYGFNIKFKDNKATASGGAVHTGRNMYLYGAGGVSGPLWTYGSNYGIEVMNNMAGYYGGGFSVELAPNLPINRRALRFVRGSFINNTAGDVNDTLLPNVRGGGGLYTINADLNVVKGVEFRSNRALNGNGGGIAVVTPDTLTRKRFMVTDLDEITYAPNGVATGYSSRNDVFTFQTTAPRADERMLTRFYDNTATENPKRMGSGTTQQGDIDVVHGGTTLRENGTGLGGALYILDSVRVRVDTFAFDRVRIQGNIAYTGAAVYSDNYDLKLAFQRCFVTNNRATSNIGRQNDTIVGPMVGSENPASSDLAGAILYGEVVGPLPWNSYGSAANSIYDNDARFTIRVPDAQDTKGVLAGTTGIGFGGVDTLRGNYWGRTEANVNTILPLSANNTFQRIQETFFVAGNGKTHMRFVRNSINNTTEQGPFESTWRITYKPVPTWMIPDTLLQEGRIYDIFDKGTDIKTADYSRRRMAPIEDFSVGIPPTLVMYNDATKPSFGKYVKRMTRDPYDAELYDHIAKVQTEFVGDHPIAYPLFLETRADYSQTSEISNNDQRAFNETVFFVINERTGDYIRVNMRQKTKTDTIFRARVELVPDSTNGGDPNIRRAYEGLATYGSGATLLTYIADNAIAEDSAALSGRRWDGSTIAGELGGPSFRLGNRPSLPTSNEGKETYYGGERFRALPVREGDNVLVVSRTMLWKNGVVDALNGALTFSVSNTTVPPVFTGSGDTLANSPLIHPEMRNRVFITENRLYTPITALQSTRPGKDPWFNEPGSYPADSAGIPIPSRNWEERDSIFNITAVDPNLLYDPRVIMDSTKGSQLSYYWMITDNKSALKYWLRDTLVTVANANDTSWGAVGYRFLRGRPINPYIVPGGEEVEVVAKNFPPSIEMVDSLRKSGISEEVISHWLYLYPKYFHAEEYDNNALPLGQRNPDNTNARFLQQDTVNFGWLDTTSYRFRIHVVDSMPRFLWAFKPGRTGPQYTRMLGAPQMIVLDPTTTDTNTFRNDTFLDTLRMTPTESRVARMLVAPANIVDEVYNDPGQNQNDSLNIQFVANLTDSLRFKLDVNTDDEYEDMAAVDANRYVVQKYGPWDFRYGKTAYGFLSTIVRDTPGDTTLDELIIARPVWMSPKYMRQFNASGNVDPNAVDFTTSGKINIRISDAEARQILKPINDAPPYDPRWRDLNTDSVVSIIVNDGHGGINTLTRRVFVNVQPKIETLSLLEAVEDTDYNLVLLDSARTIKIYDPNWGQKHTFELVYQDDPRDSVPVDPYFPEAGSIILDSSRKTTPKWLKINPESGLLYGTARVTDVPFDDTTVQVTVIVEDAGLLKDIATVDLLIKAVNHDPKLLASPILKCFDLNKPYTDTITVADLDLKRKQADNEQLTFEVIEPSGSWTFTPNRLSSPIADTQKVVVSTPSLGGFTLVNGRVTIRIRVTDRKGASEEISYQVAISDTTRFTAEVRVQNNFGAFQILEFGTGQTAIATRGDESSSFGQLDSNYCEYELPPVPPTDVFDARWTIPTKNGILRNIFPHSTTPGEAIFRARFQAGGETGQASNYYPIKLSWCSKDIPALDPAKGSPGSYYIRDDISNGALFSFNMKTGVGTSAADITHVIDSSGAEPCHTIVINRTSIEGFIILYDFTTGLDDDQQLTITNVVSITKAMPNPFTSSTSITFYNPVGSNVKVDVYDSQGSLVETLANRMFDAGSQTIEWNGASSRGIVASGTYTIRVSDGKTSATHQVVLIR
ncbi:MAG: T9SS type A sorting domain-containing protein [Ignavibacteria bacterium]|nr:T9SS type A sorting domain-containing protein [Ignavibacteria bacterium]